MKTVKHNLFWSLWSSLNFLNVSNSMAKVLLINFLILQELLHFILTENIKKSQNFQEMIPPPLVQITECPNNVIIPTNPISVTAIPGNLPSPTQTRPACTRQQPYQTTPQRGGCQQCPIKMFSDSTCDSACTNYEASTTPSSPQIQTSQSTTTVQSCVTGLDGLRGAMLALPACVMSSIPLCPRPDMCG
jgi:hypothetical protein